MKKIILIFLILFPLLANSQEFIGQDILGLAKQDIGMISDTLDNKTCLGTLQGTFGDAIPPLERLINTGKVNCFRAHLGNGPCQRNHTCERGEPKPTDFKILGARAKAFEELWQRHQEVACFLSPYLEHDVTNKEVVNTWLVLLKNNAPDCRIVISAVKGYRPPNVLQEKHGNTGTSDVRSNDGNSLFDSNSEVYRVSGRVITLGWIHSYNLNASGDKTFTPPSKRKHKTTRAELIQAIRLLKPMHPKPRTACKDIKSPDIWKTNAEDYQENNDPRGNKPLLIMRTSIKNMNLTDPANKKVGCLKYYGPFITGQARLYEGSCSGLTPDVLMDKAGGEWGMARAGNACWNVNFIRRLGSYR